MLQIEVKTVNRDEQMLRELRADEARLKELYVEARCAGWTWQAAGAAFGLAGGTVAATLGTLLSAGAWMLGDKSNGLSLHGAGSLLLLSTIPLLLVGGHCLDLLEKQKVQSEQPRSENLRKAITAKRHPRSYPIASVMLVILLCGIHAQAQQTVFNVPTTDVLAPGQAYFELDVGAKPNAPQFSSFVPRGVLGVGGRVEVGLNVTGNVQPGADTTTLVPSAKWKVYDGEDNGWAIALGNNLFVPVRNKSYDFGTYAYVMAQKTFKPGTRVGFGGYFFSQNVVAPDANRAGGQFTFEQTVTKRLNLNADWFTGRHANGYFTSGGAYKFTGKLTGVAAYSVGNANAARGNHFFYFELGYNVN